MPRYNEDIPQQMARFTRTFVDPRNGRKLIVEHAVMQDSEGLVTFNERTRIQGEPWSPWRHRAAARSLRAAKRWHIERDYEEVTS